jgi:hypothetical protein
MTASEVIARAKEVRQTSAGYSQFLKWINTIEGRIQVEIMGRKLDEITTYTEQNDNTDLLIPMPYDEAYVLYLCAMIDFFNEEWDLYANDAEVFEKTFEDYKAAYLKSVPGAAHQIHGWWGA